MAFSDIQYSDLLQSSDPALKVTEIPLQQITCLEQIRLNSNKGFETDSLQKLAESIKDVGLQEPVIVRRNEKNDGYILVCGERRYRASKIAGKATIPALVKEDLTDPKTILILQITENAQREGISNLELAQGARKLLDLGMSREEICAKLHITKSTLSELSKMLVLPDFLMDMLKNGTLSESPRTCAEYQRFYEAYPDEVEAYIREYLRDLGDEAMASGDVLLDRRVFREMREAIEASKLIDVNPDVAETDTADSSTNAAESSHDEPVSDVDNITDEADPAVFNQDNSDDPSYEIHEREHSAQPSLFSSNQDNSAPTAAVGSSSDFTDRDTRESHDLSDSISEDHSGEFYDHHDEEQDRDDPSSETDENTDEGNSNVTEVAPFKKFIVNYALREYELTRIRGRDDNYVMLRDENGSLHEVKLSEIVILRGE